MLRKHFFHLLLRNEYIGVINRFVLKASRVILPFCKGCGSRNVKQPWPTAAWV